MVPATVGRTVRQAALAVVAAGVIVGSWYWLEHHAQRHGFFDLRIYRNAVRWWLDGHPLYSYVQPHTGGFGFTYPPAAALLMTPLAPLTLGEAALVVSAATAVAITVTTWWLVAPVAERHGWPRWFALAVAVPLSCLAEPVRETVAFGQVNMLLVLLVLADIVALGRGSRLAGLGIGVAAAVKLTPAIFVVYLLVTGRRRAAAVAAATAVGLTVLAAVVAPATSWAYWTDALWQTSRVGRLDYTSNQSLLGLLARLADPGEPSRLAWAAGVVVVLGVGFSRARRAWLAGDDLAGLTLAGLTGTLVSPISWTHHLYWVVPAVVICLDVGVRAADGGPHLGPTVRPAGALWAVLAIGTWWVFASSMIWPDHRQSGQHWAGGLSGVLAENAYVLVCVALLCALPFRRAARAATMPVAARVPVAG